MITPTNDEEIGFDKVQFAEQIILAEHCIARGNANIASIVNTTESSLPSQFTILTQAKNLMGTQSGVLRVKNAALSNFEASSVICSHNDKSFITFLLSAPRLTSQMLKSYRQEYWVLISEFSDTKLKNTFGDLQRIFGAENLRQEVSDLLAIVPACCRLCCDGNKFIIQIYFRSES